MASWSEADGFQLNVLQEEFTFAYTNRNDFKFFPLLELDRSWGIIAPAGPYGNQLLEVLVEARSGGRLPDLVRAVLRNKPSSPKLPRLDRAYDLTHAEVSPGVGAIEDVVRQDSGFADLFPWVEKLAGNARSVCRIEHPVARPAALVG